MTHGILTVDLRAEARAAAERHRSQMLEARARHVLNLAGWTADEGRLAEVIAVEYPNADEERRAATRQRALELQSDRLGAESRLPVAETAVQRPAEFLDAAIGRPMRPRGPRFTMEDLEIPAAEPPAADEEDEMPRPRRERVEWLAEQIKAGKGAQDLKASFEKRWNVSLSIKAYAMHVRWAEDLLAKEAAASASPSAEPGEVAEGPAAPTAPDPEDEAAEPAAMGLDVLLGAPADDGATGHERAPAGLEEPLSAGVAALREEVRSLRERYESGRLVSIIEDGEDLATLIVVIPGLRLNRAHRASAAVSLALTGDLDFNR